MKIHVNCITCAVESIIGGWPSAVNSNWTVTREHEFNSDPNQVPWIGIYTPIITVDPSRSNIVDPFMAIMQIPVIAQTMNYDSVPNAIMELNDLTGDIYTAVSCYRDLLGTVHIVKGFEIEPYNRVKEDENVLVSNQLTIIVEVFA